MKNKTINYLFLFIYTSLLLTGCATQPTSNTKKIEEQAKSKTPIQSLGNNQYKIGNIQINKSDQSFTITGKFLRTEPPLEFLAVAKDGDRGYESLLELDVDVFQFNLACILIGLDKNKGKAPEFHFDSEPLKGDSVEILISWEAADGKKYSVEAANLFQFEDKKLAGKEWVYTGSSFLPDTNEYLPAVSGGTLIGFIHDPASIIEHRFGFGQGSYSQIQLDKSLPISIDMQITVQVKYVGN